MCVHDMCVVCMCVLACVSVLHICAGACVFVSSGYLCNVCAAQLHVNVSAKMVRHEDISFFFFQHVHLLHTAYSDRYKHRTDLRGADANGEKAQRTDQPR